MNLGKLVPLEVHGRVGNAKIAQKYFPMSEWSVPYTVGKLKKRPFQQAKEHTDQIPGWEIRPREVPGLKVGNSWECLGSVPERPHDPKEGGPAPVSVSWCSPGPAAVELELVTKVTWKCELGFSSRLVTG